MSFSFAKSKMPVSLTCDKCPSRTTSTIPLGFLGRKRSFSHVINISGVTYTDFFDIITAEPRGKPFSNSCFSLTPLKIHTDGRKCPSGLQQVSPFSADVNKRTSEEPF
jgi:hypothetical protein